MGQYYKPAFLKNETVKGQSDIKGWFYSHNHKSKWTRDDGEVVHSGNGLKIMEHSYVGNNFVSEVERHLAETPQRLVWAGDYADAEPGNLKFEWKDSDGNSHQEEDANIYSLCQDDKEIVPKTKFPKSIAKKYRYIVNLDKKEFVDKSKCPDIEGWEGAQIHPLPLLTCEGNGRGGGDFRGEHPLVGAWARDTITIQTSKPSDGEFKELVPNFKEG